MANSVVTTEESYAFNLEWIAAGSGIGEEICGVDKDCIVMPGSPGLHKEDGHLQEVEDYVEIQVTEEEVVTDQWQSQHNGHLWDAGCRSEEDPLGLRLEPGSDDLVVPLPQVQDEYARLHPYPCDFCSRRFSKKSALTAHMVSHQVERNHGCNMCGAQYKRKHDLVEHMKQHAYAPERSLEEDFEELMAIPQTKTKAKRKKSRVKSPSDVKPPRRVKRPPPLPPPPISQVYQQEEEPPQPPQPQPTRFPIIDPSRPYVCQDCGVGFAREKALNSHVLIHAGDSAFECERCHDMFQTAEQLREHDVSRHGRLYPRQTRSNEGGTFQCDNCSTSFHWYNQLKKHQRDHPKCAEESNGDGLMCPLCNMVYDTLEQLQIHKEEHENDTLGVHSCEICGEVYEHLEELKGHMKLRHRLIHTCHFCDIVFKDAKSLNKHSLTHIDERTYPCQICGARFHNRGKLKKHLTMHDDEKKGVTCSECGVTLAEGRSLIAHMQNEHGANMSRLFPCSQCGKTFTSRSSQQIHVRVHTGEKPYGCRFCWKAFADGGTLRKHERIHTGEKPYVCPVCSKAFNQRVVLREHVRAHHSGSESRLSTNCYECIVCGKMFGTSRELCLHLVHHSDENTAKHRLPSSSPRKLVGRRRKYSNNFFSAPFPKQESLSEMSDSSQDSGDFKDKKKSNLALKKMGGNKYQEDGGESYEPVIKTESGSTLEELIGKSGVKRARIVRSGKKGYPKGNNKRFMKGKGKAARLMSSTSYASKYVVTRTEAESLGMQDLLEAVGVSGTGETEEVEVNGDTPPQRSRPRTKNVSYHNMKMESKFELATFPLENPEPKSQSRKNRKGTKPKIKKEEQAIDTQFVNGIDPSLFDDENCGEQIETCIVDDIGVELKLEVKTTEPEDFPTVSESMVIKSELVSCEMCSEVFTNRSDLLKHIQVHI